MAIDLSTFRQARHQRCCKASSNVTTEGCWASADDGFRNEHFLGSSGSANQRSAISSVILQDQRITSALKRRAGQWPIRKSTTEWALSHWGRLEVCCKRVWKNHHRHIFPLLIPCEKCSNQPLVDYSMLVHNSIMVHILSKNTKIGYKSPYNHLSPDFIIWVYYPRIVHYSPFQSKKTGNTPQRFWSFAKATILESLVEPLGQVLCRGRWDDFDVYQLLKVIADGYVLGISCGKQS